MKKVALDEAQTKLTDLIAAAVSGEDVFITRNDQLVIQLVPVTPPVRRPQFGSAQGRVQMAADFDAPLADFGDYMP